MKNRLVSLPMARIILATFALATSLGLMACSNALQNGVSPLVPNKDSFLVSVLWNGGDIAASKSAAFDNGSVTAVTVLVYNASGVRIGSGALAKRTSNWEGSLMIAENGSAVFEANALNSSNAILYVGRITQTLTGTNDIVTIPVGLAGLKGGSIQGYTPSLSTAVNTFAGSATAGTGTAELPGLLTNPYQMTTDGTNLYVVDMGSNNIRKIVIATQSISTFAGQINGAAVRIEGIGTAAGFITPRGITTDGTYLYIADYGNHAIRRITISTGLVESYAGTLAATAGATENAAADAALFNGPSGITTDGIYLYVADTNNNKIRRIVIGDSNGTRAVSTLSGPSGVVGTAGWNDGSAAGAQFSGPQGITTDGTNLYVADTGNNRIRQIRISDGETSTLAGSGATGSVDSTTGTLASFYSPIGITNDGTYLYIADTTSNKIRRVAIAAPNGVTTLAGSGTATTVDGLGTAATFNGPSGITTDGTNLYVSDYGGYTIRKIQ